MAPCSSSNLECGRHATALTAAAWPPLSRSLQRLDRIELIDQARPLADVPIAGNAEPDIELRRVRGVAFHQIDEAAMLEDDDLPVLVVRSEERRVGKECRSRMTT